ncbi:MAG: PHP domain-containing protein [Deferrisomatales bacterium]|nr:PHP domain-containing protein [Deferrisomatales bacterium]
MRIQVDLHVHTLASGHAFSTVVEIAREANLRRLRAVGIADHGPGLPGGPHPYHFSAMRFLPRAMEGVRILRGVEANLMDAKGTIDLPRELAERLDYVMVGFHHGCGFNPGSARSNTRAFIKAMDNPRVKVLTHPGNPAFPVDVPELVAAAAARGVALEINNASFSQNRAGSYANCTRIAAELARVGGPVCLSSDAHVATQVGEVKDAWAVAEAAGVIEAQVVNRTYTECLKFLGLDEAEMAGK